MSCGLRASSSSCNAVSDHARANLECQHARANLKCQDACRAHVAHARSRRAVADAHFGWHSAQVVRDLRVSSNVTFVSLLVSLLAGFATLAAGSIREKNVRNILLKNGLDACVGCVVWYLVGFGLAGPGDNGFIGNDPANFALSGLDDITSHVNGYNWISFFFSYTFAAAAATIVSGAVAERCKVRRWPVMMPAHAT
jgi:hypothetical protein